MEAYFVLSKISPRLRNLLTVLLVFVGYLLQVTSRNMLVGLPFIAGGLIVNLIKNFSLKPIRNAKLQWREVTPEKIAQVHAHCQRLNKIQGGNWGCLFVFLLIFFSAFFIIFVGEMLQSIESAFPLF